MNCPCIKKLYPWKSVKSAWIRVLFAGRKSIIELPHHPGNHTGTVIPVIHPYFRYNNIVIQRRFRSKSDGDRIFFIRRRVFPFEDKGPWGIINTLPFFFDDICIECSADIYRLHMKQFCFGITFAGDTNSYGGVEKWLRRLRRWTPNWKGKEHNNNIPAQRKTPHRDESGGFRNMRVSQKAKTYISRVLLTDNNCSPEIPVSFPTPIEAIMNPIIAP